MKVRRKPIPLHPILVAIFPLVSLYSANVHYVGFYEVRRPLVAVVALTVLGFLALLPLLKNRFRAAAVVSVGWIFCFSYSHVQAIADLRSLFLVPSVFLSFLVLSGIIVRQMRSCARQIAVTRFLNTLSLFLVLIAFAGSLWKSQDGPAVEQATNSELGLGNVDAQQPDIYFIVVDGMCRIDVLEDKYGVDASEFEHVMRENNVSIAEASTANYFSTQFSLACTLNMQYLDDLFPKANAQSANIQPVQNAIQDSEVIRRLRDIGYHIVCLDSGWEPTRLRNVDEFLSVGEGFSEFEQGVINLTPLRPFLQHFGQSPYELHRRRIDYAFKELPGIAKRQEPSFTIAHLICPHPPFVFGQDGDDTSPHFLPFSYGEAGGKGSYASQAKYLLKRLPHLVHQIRMNSAQEPIIIIQADHGWDATVGAEVYDSDDALRYPVFNCWHLPGKGKSRVYDKITPVNTFRVIFEEYFGQDCPLLDDRNYFVHEDRPFQYIDITDKVQAKQTPANGQSR